MKLTNTTIKQMAYGKANNKADLRFDDELRGFGVRVYPSNRKAFFISYRNATGTKKRHNFGNFGEFTATNARKLAQDLLADIRRGNDPQVDRQEKREELTFEVLADRYIEDYAKDHKRSWKDDAQRLRDHLLPGIGKRKLSEITLSQLQKIHSRLKKEKSPATANRVAALVKHIFTKAGEWKLINDNPTMHLKMFTEPPPRDIALTPDQCRELIEACDADENVYAASLFKLAMFTGRRVGELLGAKWTDVNLDKGILTLPQTKAGERQFVYLNDPATAVLRTLPRIEGNQYVIVGNVPGKPLNFYRRAWNRILKRTEIEPFPPHGLRHNYASTLVAAGVPLETVGHLLGHKNSVTTRKYAHHRPDQLHRAAHTFAGVIDFKVEKEKRNR
jgi:integrase